MKNLWNIFSFLAVVHLLALAGFVGWLWQSDRLNSERINTIRELFAPTLGELEKAAKDQAKADAAAAADAQANARLESAPVTSGHQIRMMSAVHELSQESQQQLEQERGIFAQQLDIKARSLDQREADFETRKTLWEQGIEEERQRRTDEQFAKAVALMELMKPAQAKDTIVRLMREGSAEQAVAYLNAMADRTAARVLGEMKDPTEAGLATVLLERLRRFGLEGEPDEVLSDADQVASAP
jgi:flagellar motility protein MotE (MotC chaperone)